MAQFVESLKGLGTTKLAIMGGVALALMIGFTVLISMSGGGNGKAGYAPLFNNLSLQDGSKVTAALDSMQVPYELKGNGSQIFVPEEQVLNLRMKLAGEGLPTSGSVIGYEIFDKSDTLGTSNFVYNVNMVRALEGELARTIDSFTKVDHARVHLVLPKRELFTREKQEPSASVVLKMNPGASLTTAEISSIRHLVASAVPELKVSKITITDTRGKLLAKGSDDPNDPEYLNATAEEFRIAYERRIKTTIEELLEQSVGQGKVTAQVSAMIDFSRVVTNNEEFDPDSKVERSVQASEEKEKSNERDVNSNVSVQNNLPDGKSTDAGTLTSSEAEKKEQTTNFEISKKTTNQVKETGTVNRISIAVLVDGTYVKNEAGESTYTPRSAEELKKLEKLVKSAIGFDETRGDSVEVVNMQFPEGAANMLEESPMDWLKQDFHSIVQTLVLGVVAILAILLVVKPLVNRALEASNARFEEEAEEEQLALAGPGGVAGQLPNFSGEGGGEGVEGDDSEADSLINIDRVNGQIRSSTMRKISGLIEKNPEEALRTIRTWLSSDHEPG